MPTIKTQQIVSFATLKDCVASFLWVDLADKSPATRVWYARRLERMAEQLGMPIADIQDMDLLAYIASLSGGLSAYTVHGHVRAIKRFWTWLYQRGIMPVNLASSLKLPKLPRKNKVGISEANLTAILEAARGNVRDYALLRFIESTGCRRGGAANLLLSDLDMGAETDRLRRRAVVREKGDKERVVIMSSECLRTLAAWLEIRPAIADEHVFLGRSPGQAWRALSDEGISRMVERYKKELGLIGPCSPHQWRHRWARHRLHKGMELSQVSQLLGHEDVSITVRFYGQFSLDALQDAYDRWNNE